MAIERRYIQELRAGDGDGMTLAGYAAKFNTPTVIANKFREIIAPGAFTRALAAKQDVRALFNHDVNTVLGRTASGTLALAEDSTGLLFLCQLDPSNTEHKNIYASVKRQNISEMSFAFLPNGENGEEWRQSKDGLVRTLRDVDLFDISVVTRPAYAGTSVQARSEEALTALDFDKRLFPPTRADLKHIENLRRLLDAASIF
jgi:Escherichia/Staphylococcus phage prohead protease